jgi:hypothetical protein
MGIYLNKIKYRGLTIKSTKLGTSGIKGIIYIEEKVC